MPGIKIKQGGGKKMAPPCLILDRMLGDVDIWGDETLVIDCFSYLCEDYH